MGQLGRRRFLLGVGAAALAEPIAGLAQRTSKTPRIGILSPDAAKSRLAHTRETLIEQSLARFGYKPGSDLVIEWRYTEGSLERRHLDELANDLVRRNVDVIVAHGDVTVHAAARATTTIPIVAYGYNRDPVEQGLVASLARPGGNVTGTTWFIGVIEQIVKQYEIVREALPTAIRLAALWQPWLDDLSECWRIVNEIHDRIHKAFGFVATNFVVNSAEEIPSVLEGIAVMKPDVIYISELPAIMSRLAEIVKVTIEEKLPSTGTSLAIVEQGALFYYGIDQAHLIDRTMSFVDRILRGAKPAMLPIERPDKFELVLNAKTARAIGYTLPTSLELRLDRVIE